MAERREHRLWRSGLATVLLMAGTPLAAQTTPPANNSATPAPAPPPADGSLIGPPQLRDFNLNGTVTRPAETVATPTPPPARTAPGPATAPPREAAGGSAPSPVRTTPPVAGPDRDASADTVAIDLPPPTPADPAAMGPGFGDAPVQTAPATMHPVDRGFPWPWLLAALAVVLAAAFLAWRKRHGSEHLSYAGVSDLVSPVPATAPLPRATPTPVPLPRAATPTPAPFPRAAAPRPSSPAPKPPAPRPDFDGGIVSSGLRPRIVFELHPIRAETDDRRGAALLFDVIVVNNGHAPARDVLVEARLLNAGPRQDEQIGAFFREPVGKGERLPMIPPMGRISIKSRLSIPGDQMQPIEIDGRQLFVPLVAFNALYRWSGGEEQDSASFLVGRGQEDGGKMAPFRLDQGAKSWTGLGARPHSMGLQRTPA